MSHAAKASLAGLATLATAAALVLAPIALALPAAQATTGASSYHPVTPTRVLDTRSGVGASGPVAAKGTATLTLPAATVPASASSVVLTLTVTQGTASGYVTAFPAGTTKPTASNLNFKAAQTISNLAIVKIGTGSSAGRVSFYNGSTGTIELLADVSGYYAPGTSGLSFHPVDTAAVMDTAHFFGVSGPIKPKATITLTLPNEVIPPGVQGVAINVTASNTKATGFATVFPAGTALPVTSNVNFKAGATVADLVFVKTGAGNKVSFYNGSTGDVDLEADAAGYFTTAATGSPFHSIAPTRVLDTRSGVGVAGPIAGHGSATLTLPAGAVPAGATSAALNLTVIGSTAAGDIETYRSGQPSPFIVSVAFKSGQTIADLAIVRLSSGNKVTIQNDSSGSVQVLADVAGYFAP